MRSFDGVASAGSASVEDMRYYNAVEEGWRADGWYEMDGSEDVGTDVIQTGTT